MSDLILIVEDEPDIASTLAYNLKKQGYSVDLADTGTKGLKRAGSLPTPDLILLDLMLPDMTGHAVCNQIGRIQAVLRRCQRTTGDTPSLRAGRIRIDIGAHRVWAGDDEIELTAIEYRLLRTFVERKDRVQSRDQLIDAVWGMGTAITNRTIDVHIKRLRAKLGPEASTYIDTVWGVGYRLVIPE